MSHVPADDAKTVPVSSMSLDLYNWNAIQGLPKDGDETFFSKYAQGDWSSLQLAEVPHVLEAEVMSDMSSQTTESNKIGSEDTGISRNGARTPPPDLTQSMANVYQSFMLNLSHSDHPTNFSISNPDSGSTRAGKHVKATPTNCPDGYAAHHSRRYRQLGYLEPPMPATELQRRKVLQRFKPFHTKMDPNLDRIERLGMAMFSADASVISLVDADEVHITFNGSDPFTVPRTAPVCGHTILQPNGEPHIILDTLEDWRFKGNSFVTAGVRFYAGVPLLTEEGENIGVYCVLDRTPRKEFTREAREQLKELGIMTIRELQRKARDRDMALQGRMRLAVTAFNQETISGTSTMDEVLLQMADHIISALSVDGVLIFDAYSGQSAHSELRMWHSQAGTMDAPDHTGHWTTMSSTPGEYSIIDYIFQEHPDGMVHSTASELPTELVRLLPESITAGIAVPILKSRDKPFALICAYSLASGFFFQLPDATCSFLNAMGIILCNLQQRQALSQADRAKIDFIANISHELRTPLHGILASCDLLSETNLDGTQASFLNTAAQCANNLTEVINHVLDFTKSTSQSMGNRREAVVLSQFIEETMVGCWLGRIAKRSPENSPDIEVATTQDQERLDAQIMAKVEPLIEVEPSLNWTVMVDKAGLRRVLINLIGNSIKFTQEGYIKLRLYQSDQKDPLSIPIEIAIEDTGPGISAAFIRERLFHPFSQENPLAQGVGLGLAIVHALLKSPGINGSIDVQSEVGKGTQMLIQFDAPLVPGSVLSPLLPPPALVWGQNFPSVAFVGFLIHKPGSWNLAQYLRQQLIRWYTTVEEKGLADTEILIIDADNIESKLLTDPARRHQKILLLASSPTDKKVLKAAQDLSLDGGICIVRLKPIGPHGLAQLLSEMVEHSIKKAASPSLFGKKTYGIVDDNTSRPQIQRADMRNGSLVHGSSVTPSTPNSITPTDFTMPRVLIVEDNRVNRRILSAYLRKRGLDYAEAENGEEGVNIFKAHPPGHFDVCLMDLQMPIMDGFDATSAIRQIEEKRLINMNNNRRIKVFALTGLDTPEDKEQAVIIGFDGYLVKPVSLNSLDDVFKTLFHSI